jgi:[protein-PII] uridylyltransferase
MIGWVVKRHFGATTLRELVTNGFLTESEYAALMEGQNTLWRLRFALHLLTGRCEDRLLFDYQQTLAKQFGYQDEEHHLGVETFMKSYYRTVMELDRLNEMLLALFRELILFDPADTELIAINDLFQARNGLLEVVRDDVFSTNPLALLEVFVTLQAHPEIEGVRAATIRLIRDNRHRIDDEFRRDPRARALFMRFLRKPRGVTHGLRRMHRYGVLAAYLPVFANIVGQMQYDLFHAYTVDEHTLFVVRNVRAFAVPEKRHEFPLCSEIFQRLLHPELLYLAALFHDIAKGRGGDHSELGAEEALNFCVAHGLSQYSTRLVAWLVRHHLLLSVTAQRRDISDPDVINDFASKVGDHVHLDYLYLLTVADIRGTNPKLWNDWKNALLRDLYESTLRALRHGLENPIDKAELIEDTQSGARDALVQSGLAPAAVEALWSGLGDDYFLRDAPDEIAWHTQGILGVAESDLPLVLVRNGHRGTEIFVYAPDQDYLFAASTAVLDRLGLNIVDSRIITADNAMTLNSYIVLESNAKPISGEQRAHEIRTRLTAELKNPRPVPRKSARRGRRQLRHFSILTRVTFDRDDTNKRTILEVICADRPGLLSRIGWALAESGISVLNAKIATYGERAEDVFFVRTNDNEPLDAEREDTVRQRIIDALGA